MSNSSLSGKVEGAFREQFSGSTLLYEKVDLGNGKAHAFFVDFEKESELKNVWQKMVNFVALHFQNKLESQFERWNIYLFFRLLVPIQKGLKYKIENDTFSSRKIILEKEVNNQTAVETHILNSLINIGAKELKAPKSLDYNPILLEELKGKTLRKIKTTPEAQIAYYKIIEIIKQNQ